MTLPTRQQAIDSAIALVSDPRTVYLKVETTGLSARDEVVEIAIVHAVSGDILLNSPVKPSFRYPMHDKLLHGLSYDMVADAPTIDQLNVREILDGKRVVVYGKDFASKMIDQSYSAQDKKFYSYEAKWHCAMTLYGAFAQEMSWTGDSYKWWKFDDALEALHINNEKRNHRALEEAKSIGFLLWNIAHTGEGETVKRDPLPRYFPLDFDDHDRYDRAAYPGDERDLMDDD